MCKKSGIISSMLREDEISGSFLRKSCLVIVLAAFILVFTSTFASIATEAAEKTYRMRIAGNLPKDSYEGKIHLEFEERLENKTDSIEVKLYPSGQLGSPPQVIDGLQAGNFQAYNAPIGFLSGVVPATQVLNLPCLFNSREQAFEILNNSDVMKKMNEEMKTKGFVPAAYLVMDYRTIISDKRIDSMEDFKGMRIRTMATPPEQLEMEAFGASGVPVHPSEVYTALQQGMVDGVCSGIHFFNSNRLYEVADYLNMTKQAPIFSPYIISKAWLEKLPADLQEIVVQTAYEVIVPWGYKKSKEIEKAALQNMKKEGITVVEASPEFRENLFEASLGVHKKILKELPEKWNEFYKDLKAEIQERR